ncbi:ring-hydroxylating dioxygenase subunit beta [Burkholderia sp. Bp9017]|uniref:Nuclear transport factor 2 family protein n=1 Tax=Burkholderia anthina TaxID=179879 RepID=A0A7T7AJ70_9BURK|nr:MULTISPECIES: aromatic-ring-hydroxylating dioxygenase subunit beta [Burkholderia]MBY4868270.1 nuclear transport factor 2 family protein [Burkholderia anthina]QQK04636.1 nuclear transport factor 2 family protein [Burkholderia anthina]RQZ21949.1 ring-hydroxylating dioxygenase subunit beta [Burkholderia sp. Bp9017]RQZ30329.1 ring-hydroxylating dioxygenase subunit beta [Burkholderia sp. Bp9016]
MLKGFDKKPIAYEAAIAARMAVEAFHAEYCATLDGGEIERWPEFFAEQCVYRVTEYENAELGLPVGLVYAEGRDMLRDRAVAISRTQMFAPRRVLHLVTNVRILDANDEEIVAQSNYVLLQTLVEGATSVHQAGRLYDRFARNGSTLLLKERQAVYDTALIANDLAYPV